MANSTLFYKEPTVLAKDNHAELTFRAAGDLSFSSEMNSVPVAGVEFPQTLHDHPVFFVKSEKEAGYTPVCLLSLTNGVHSLGDNWGNQYVPAFLRRYPFGVTTEGTVVFDNAAPHFEGDGEKLFNDAKEPTERLQEIINFLGSVDASYRETDEFCKALADKEMLVPINQAAKIGEKTINLNQLYKIDEAKLYALDAAELHEWFNKKWIAWSYSHLASIQNLNKVVARVDADDKIAAEKKPQAANA